MLKSPSLSKEILSANYQDSITRLAFYLWDFWKDYLISKNIFPKELNFLMKNKYGKLIEQLPDKKSWEKFVNSIKQDLLSNEIDFYFVFSIEPPSVFGLPDNDVIVIPSGEKFVSPVFHTLTGERIDYGTLSRYREVKHKLRFSGNEEDIKYSLDDNFLRIRFKAKSNEEALTLATNTANKLVFLLTLITAKKSEITTVFKHRLRKATDQYGRDVLTKWPAYKFKVVWYQLGSLKQKLKWAFSHTSHLNDTVLEKSLKYFYYALFLNLRRGELRPTGFSNHMESTEKVVYKFLVSDIILNLYKSVSTIVGDPTKDKDYQKRYKKFGIDKSFWENNIEELRKLRNDWDVAHYSISDDKLQELTEKIGKAIVTAQAVIIKYISWKTSL